jgi:hypothetical protein
MTAHKSRNASNSRNESNNTTANTLWTPAKAGMLAKVVKPAFREANCSRDSIKIRDDSSSRDNRNIMNVISSRTSTAEERLATARISEVAENSQQQY